MTQEESIKLVQECWKDADQVHASGADPEDRRLTVALLLRARLAPSPRIVLTQGAVTMGNVGFVDGVGGAQ